MWAGLLQLRRVQAMINNEPASALGRQMTRSQALYGEPNQRVLQASAESLAELLGGARCAGQTHYVAAVAGQYKVALYTYGGIN